MPGIPAPYTVPATRFPFPALAALAARAPLGAREVALGCLMAARLAFARRLSLDVETHAARAAAARTWFASVALPAALRAPIARFLDAVTRADDAELGGALGAVTAQARRHLDRASIAELEAVVGALKR